MSEPNTEWDNVPASRVLPAWREQVRMLSLEINELREKNEALRSKVKRMTEAGYAMAVKINVHGINDKLTDNRKLVDDWSAAAKDGIDLQ
jgi:FtsZ-binding cell division protein ZapB